MFLVTGGTGFLGGYILKELVDRGYSVRAIRRSSKLPFYIPKHITDKVEWVEADLLDVTSLNEAMVNIDTVIHSGAIVSFSKEERKQMYQVNVEGTANVVNLSIQNNISKLIHISSVAALGRTTKTDTINESKKWENTNNNTHYSITKNEAEMHVWRGFGEGLDGVILNPSTILGYGDWNESSCTLFKSAYKGFPWYTEGINGFVGVEDVAALTVEVAVSAISQKRFIVNSENWSFRQLFNTIADEFNKPRPTRKATPAIGELAWRLEKIRSLFTGKKPLLTKETSKVAHSHTSFDNSALLSFLPHFQYTPIATVIKESCEKYLMAMNKGMLTL